jgi:hypothetical protein
LFLVELVLLDHIKLNFEQIELHRKRE